MSERIPNGRLAMMPGMVEAAAIKPISGSDAPKLIANKVNVGLFDIVVLKIANKPMAERKKKGEDISCLVLFMILKPFTLDV
jgi:hypothetical protein